MPSTARQASIGRLGRGSTTSCAPIVGGERAPGRGEVGGDDRLDALRRSAAMTASPTGPQPSTTAASPGSMPERFTACSPTAIGSVSAAWRGSSPLGTVSAHRSLSTIRSP